MKLYDFPLSSNCQKVRALAYEADIPLQLVPVDLTRAENRGPAFLGMNPNAKVPVLDDAGLILWESNAILTYLATKYELTALYPVDAKKRAHVHRMLFWQAAHLAPGVARVAFERIAKRVAQLGPPDDAMIAMGKREFAVVSQVLETLLAGGPREYLLGELTIADFSVAPTLARAEEVELDVGGLPRVSAWLARMRARPSVARALGERLAR
jgi:glutathione S-transferase